jgi:hypothetical protein
MVIPYNCFDVMAKPTKSGMRQRTENSKVLMGNAWLTGRGNKWFSDRARKESGGVHRFGVLIKTVSK